MRLPALLLAVFLPCSFALLAFPPSATADPPTRPPTHTHLPCLAPYAVPEGGRPSPQLVRMRGWLLRIVQAMEL